MTTTLESMHSVEHADRRAVLVDLGVDIGEADVIATEWPATDELVPVSLLAVELDDDAAQLRRRLRSLSVRDQLGFACVPAAVVRAVIDVRDRREEAQAAREAAARRWWKDRPRRKPPTVDDLRAQLEALMADDEIAERLQVTFAESLMEQIRRLEEGPAKPEVVAAGQFFAGATDEEVVRIQRQSRKEQQSKRWATPHG